MANVDRPRGLTVIGTIDGSPVSGAVRERPVDASNATAIFPGDAVILEDDGNVAPYTSGGGNLLGVCVGVVVDRAQAKTEHPGYLPASTAGSILVAEGPDLLFEIQEDDGGTALTSAAIGSNADILATAGSTTTGRSAHELDRSTITDGSAATAQLRLIQLVEAEDNAHGDWAKWIVRINEHVHNETTGL